MTATKLLEILTFCKSWGDIHNVLSKVEKKHDCGKLFEEFCKCYYLTEPSVKNEYKNVWLFGEIPLKIKNRLQFNRKDHGTDLVLEGMDGSFSVVQCKFRSNQDEILYWGKDTLTHVIADGIKADYRVIFTNASGVDSHTLTRDVKIITYGDLIALSSSTVKNIINYLKDKNKPQIFEIYKPRPYQKEAIKAVVDGFRNHDRGQLILPCGAGKTLVSMWIKDALGAKHTIVLVPSLALLRQMKEEWHENSKDFIHYINVCSEKNIDKKGDAQTVHPSEIKGRVTTRPEEVLKFIKSHEKEKFIIYATYQSLAVVSEAIRNTGYIFDLAICDEAHKTSRHKSNEFSTIHFDEKLPVKKRLYMTATRRVAPTSLKNKLGDDGLKYLCDMSNQNIFGPELYRMNFKEAIDKNILVDYKIVAIGVEDKEIEDYITERRYVDDNITVDEIANNYALEKFMKCHGATHAITFHSTVNQAKSFQKRHQEIYPDVLTRHVNGKQTTNDRNKLMGEFENSPISVMTNARCLTEGVDVPCIDVVYFCDPKNSVIDIVQATGRALRKSKQKNKKFGYILVPLFHSEADKIEEAIEGSSFKNLVNVIQALSAHDARIEEEIKQLKLGEGNRKLSTQCISVDSLSEIICMENFDDILKDNLFFQLINKIRIPWEQFEKARKFARSLGLNGKGAWASYCLSGQRPDFIPSKPERVYKHEWAGWANWLGTSNKGPKDHKFLNYEEAKIFIKPLGLESSDEWRSYSRSGNRPNFLPANPAQHYEKRGWISWGDFLGSDSQHPGYKQCMPYADAEKYAQSLKLNNAKDWAKHWSLHKPEGIPAKPDIYYKDKGWIDWGTFLGTGTIASQKAKYRPFLEARKFVRRLGLKNTKEWQAYCKSGDKPNDIPSSPRNVYKNSGWVSMGAWLGTRNVATFYREYLPYGEAREIIHSFHISSISEWKKFCCSGQKPKNIPSAPHLYYKGKGWIDWNDWLDNTNKGPKDFRYWSFKKARDYVRSLNLINSKQWFEFCKSGKRPDSIPSHPHVIYKDEWKGMGDWLGTRNIATYSREYRKFFEGRAFVRRLGLTNRKEWRVYCKSGNKPEDIPSAPNSYYRDSGWIAWPDWLGTSN